MGNRFEIVMDVDYWHQTFIYIPVPTLLRNPFHMYKK